MSIELVHEFTFWGAVKPPVAIGPGPWGTRLFFEVTGGEARGERFTAKAFGGGADWAVVGPDGFARLDVRIQFETDDGAFVYAYYDGLLEMNEAVGAALQNGTGTDYADQYFRTTPHLETGDERYAWVNQSVFVARGHVLEGRRVEYEVYRAA
jgi:hypothetical protein